MHLELGFDHVSHAHLVVPRASVAVRVVGLSAAKKSVLARLNSTTLSFDLLLSHSFSQTSIKHLRNLRCWLFYLEELGRNLSGNTESADILLG